MKGAHHVPMDHHTRQVPQHPRNQIPSLPSLHPSHSRQNQRNPEPRPESSHHRTRPRNRPQSIRDGKSADKRSAQNSLIVRNGKGGKDRIVSFNSTLKKLISDYLDYRSSKSPYLFHSERAEQMTRFGIGRVFKKLAKLSGISNHHSIHSLRHTYATNLYKASEYNLRLVQKQLGHSSITTTSVYSDVISKDLDIALEKLG